MPSRQLLARQVFAWLLLAGGVAAGEADAGAAIARRFEERVRPLLATYCAPCHNAEKPKGEVDFTKYTSAGSALAARDLWQRSGAALHAREMPPDTAKKLPSEDERAELLAWIDGLKRLSPKDPGPGGIRRLSRLEYANTLRELFAVDPALANDLPADVPGEGFNNTISPLLMEKYLLIADEVLDRLIQPDRLDVTWSAGELDAIIDRKQEPGVPGAGARTFSGAGEITAVVPAPVAGVYTLVVKAGSDKIGKDHTELAVRVDGQAAEKILIKAPQNRAAPYKVKLKLPEGRVRVSLLVSNPFAEVVVAAADAKEARKPRKPADAAKPPEPVKTSEEKRTLLLDSIQVIGPPSGRQTKQQLALFVAQPGKDLDARVAATRIAEAFTRRAWRRPASADEIAVLLKVFDLANDQDEVFTEAVKLMLKGALLSPQFLYIGNEATPRAAGGIVALDSHQVAQRLSYFLWACPPDVELAALADAGKLTDAREIERQARRLLADPRSEALFAGFGATWLGLNRLDDHAIDEKKYSLMTVAMRRAMYDEAALLFATILREDRPLGEFIDCDYTFLNATLAKLYGIGEVKGAQMQRVQLSDGNRGGVLTMPGVLFVTSNPNRTSPVKRGKWVLEQILGRTPPPPPMNVPALEKQDTAANASLNLRARTERHRVDPACNGCHSVLDPIGFGLENFDAIGRWREQDDTGGPVDPVGELPGKKRFSSPGDLKRLIAGRQDEFTRALSAKLLAYALCRRLDGYDEVVVDDISAAVARDGNRFQRLIVGIVTSYPFLHRKVE